MFDNSTFSSAYRARHSFTFYLMITRLPDRVFADDLSIMKEPYMAIFTTITLPHLTRRALKKVYPEADGSRNSTMPSQETGVMWRYSFLSQYLIIGIFVVVLLLIPPVLLGAHALTSIESPKGLKTKMVGAISESKAN